MEPQETDNSTARKGTQQERSVQMKDDTSFLLDRIAKSMLAPIRVAVLRTWHQGMETLTLSGRLRQRALFF